MKQHFETVIYYLKTYDFAELTVSVKQFMM